ncbi:zinc-binding dehydrogenase [Microbacterium indicum]|uniref:zinc-binding dehydrogenase n=1 Tax=Microbacterium indicum TaxID=358100 RepID=UPI00041736D6|nr:alcohol dehydrogenase catalytic domain-containing protein [Microbacterium indicum]
MKAYVFQAPHRVVLRDRPDPRIVAPGDAVVRVTATCVCGSDLWYYRGESPREHGQGMGHEFVGVVTAVGAEVRGLRPGDAVLAPFRWSDGSCAHCRFGLSSACVSGGIWGEPGADGAHGEAVRVPFADATLVRLPGEPVGREALPILAAADVLATGHHAAVSAGVRAGSSVAVIGDGAVGLCGVLAARRLGAERIVVFSRHPQRQTIARVFGADETRPERGDAVIELTAELTDGVGFDSVLECVGTGESMTTAIEAVRPGGGVGFVGVPHGSEIPAARLYGKNIRLSGGLAPVRSYLDELVPDVLDGSLDASPVFDLEVGFADLADGYLAMHERRAIKAFALL